MRGASFTPLKQFSGAAWEPAKNPVARPAGCAVFFYARQRIFSFSKEKMGCGGAGGRI
jgi:hypothetical protein